MGFQSAVNSVHKLVLKALDVESYFEVVIRSQRNLLAVLLLEMNIMNTL